MSTGFKGEETVDMSIDIILVAIAVTWMALPAVGQAGEIGCWQTGGAIASQILIRSEARQKPIPCATRTPAEIR